MPIRKLVEFDGEYGGWLEVDPVKLKRRATAFKAWLLKNIDPANDPFGFLKKDLPLVESALNGTMPLPFFTSPHNWEVREGLLPEDYMNISSPFYNTMAGSLGARRGVIMKDGKYYAWAEFEDPENLDSSRFSAVLKMERELERSGMTQENAGRITHNFVKSSSTPLVATSLGVTDRLVKIVPAGEQPSASTRYWLRESELAALLKDPANIASKLGLPPGMQADKFDIYQITPKQEVIAFESKITPTSVNGKPNTTGEATQSIVVDRTKFTPPIKIGSIDTKKGN